MILLITCMIGIIGAIIWYKTDDFVDVGPFILGIICGFIMFVVGLTLVLSPIGIRGDIKEFISVQTTINIARGNEEPIETAAMQLKVIEMNQWLANTQYYNELFFFGDFIPNEVDNLEFIQ